MPGTRLAMSESSRSPSSRSPASSSSSPYSSASKKSAGVNTPPERPHLSLGRQREEHGRTPLPEPSALVRSPSSEGAPAEGVVFPKGGGVPVPASPATSDARAMRDPVVNRPPAPGVRTRPDPPPVSGRSRRAFGKNAVEQAQAGRVSISGHPGQEHRTVVGGVEDPVGGCPTPISAPSATRCGRRSRSATMPSSSASYPTPAMTRRCPR